MKTRLLQTDFWSDETIQSMSLAAQHLYVFLLTCPHINMCGIFRLSKGLICLMARLNEQQLQTAKEELMATGKVLFYNGWVFVKNAREKNYYESSVKNRKSVAKELAAIPDDVKTACQEFTHGSISFDVADTNAKDINNQCADINSSPITINTISPTNDTDQLGIDTDKTEIDTNLNHNLSHNQNQ
ncbi:hypothetical protein IJJ12_01285, partial [bacterium]|nr:hypothetical protein [bacterium]